LSRSCRAFGLELPAMLRSALVLGLVLGLLPEAAGQVDCGAHIAASCEDCPFDGSGVFQGEVWCHGQCRWMPGPLHGDCLAQGLATVETLAVGGAGGGSFGFGLGLGVPWLLSGCVSLAFACLYKAKVVDELPILPWGKPMRESPSERGLFACFYSLDTCLYTSFCLPVVAAKNYRSAEVCSFWPACILIFLGTFSPFYCFTAAIRTALSQRVRDRLGYPSWCLQDFLITLFCFPCEVGRESLEVDEELGVKIACVCRVEKRDDEPYAGVGGAPSSPSRPPPPPAAGGAGGGQRVPLRFDSDLGLGPSRLMHFLPTTSHAAAGRGASPPYVGPSAAG